MSESNTPLDVEGAKQACKDRLAYIRAYTEHPLTKKILDDGNEQQNTLIDLLCNQPIHNFETFFAHFEAIGHLRGLRRADSILCDAVEETETELKQLEEQA